MNKLLLLLLTLTCTTSCTRSLTDVGYYGYYDTCPSDGGYSCPLDGSPCPFCNDVLNNKK